MLETQDSIIVVDQNTSHLEAVLVLGERCEYDAGHSRQVASLALHLFDELTFLHGLGRQERHWLHCAGLLHDIGWVDGERNHHKAALKIILSTPLLPFDHRERLVIGSIARYHRKALPSQDHDHYASLTQEDQEAVRRLAALLRIADGLDATHQNRICNISCKIKARRVIIRCFTDAPAREEMEQAARKSNLFEEVFSLNVTYRQKPVHDEPLQPNLAA